MMMRRTFPPQFLVQMRGIIECGWRRGCGVGICGRRLELRSGNVFDGFDYAFERVVISTLRPRRDRESAKWR
jgi:hypothetical protein